MTQVRMVCRGPSAAPHASEIYLGALSTIPDATHELRIGDLAESDSMLPPEQRDELRGLHLFLDGSVEQFRLGQARGDRTSWTAGDHRTFQFRCPKCRTDLRLTEARAEQLYDIAQLLPDTTVDIRVLTGAR